MSAPNVVYDALPCVMRSPCSDCGCPNGRIDTKGGQDCVRCLDCNKFLYNAPRTETGREVRSITTVHDALGPKDRFRILTRAQFRCEYCGADKGPVEVDHIVPVKAAFEDGWTDQQINSDENLAAGCKRCNAGKSSDLMPLRCVIALYMRRIKRGTP